MAILNSNPHFLLSVLKQLTQKRERDLNNLGAYPSVQQYKVWNEREQLYREVFEALSVLLELDCIARSMEEDLPF